MNSTPSLFRDVAAKLTANGYRVVPIMAGTKYPPQKRWQHFEYQPGCEAQFDEDCGCGVPLGTTMAAVDIDVADHDAVAAIEGATREILGIGDTAEIPRRIGFPPRLLLPFRTTTGFKKVQTALFAMHSAPEAKPSKVEILADGQQFVAYHIHPDTKRPYTWNGGGDLLTVPRAELFEITEAQARAIAAAAEGILDEWGDRIVPKHDDKAPGATNDSARWPQGGRNDRLTREAGKLRRVGLSPDALAVALQQINRERCDPPLPESEVDAIAASIGAKPTGKPDEETAWPDPLDMVALSARAPQPPQFIIPDWLPAGYATLLAGHGGIGKSALGLHMAVCVALGIPFFGLPTEQRHVTYLSCEDRENLLHWRLARICAWLGINLAEVAGILDVLDLVGRDSVMWASDPRTGFTFTSAFDRLGQQVARQQTQVLFIDGVSDTFGGNENARTEVKAYTNRMLSLTPTDGALVMLGHVAKPAAMNSATSEGYSGSTQWHNAVRARWYLYPETERSDDRDRPQRTGKLTLELQKSNLGRIDQSISFAWDQDAHMFLAAGTFGGSLVDRKHRDDTEQMGILCALHSCEQSAIVVPAASQGPRTAFKVLALRPEFPATLKSAKGRFWGQIETLRQLRLIDEHEYRRKDRHFAAQFVLTVEGRVKCGQ